MRSPRAINDYRPSVCERKEAELDLALESLMSESEYQSQYNDFQGGRSNKTPLFQQQNEPHFRTVHNEGPGTGNKTPGQRPTQTNRDSQSYQSRSSRSTDPMAKKGRGGSQSMKKKQMSIADSRSNSQKSKGKYRAKAGIQLDGDDDSEG